MDILLWIFIGILLIFGYKCWADKTKSHINVQPQVYQTAQPNKLEPFSNNSSLLHQNVASYNNPVKSNVLNANKTTVNQQPIQSNEYVDNYETIQVDKINNQAGGNSQLNCSKFQQFTQKDLLPLDESSTLWAKMNPKGDGSLEGRNFLQAGYHLGINTVGQSRKNANYQLRSDPPNPKDTVSPWMQSTVDPDVRRCFEIS